MTLDFWQDNLELQVQLEKVEEIIFDHVKSRENTLTQAGIQLASAGGKRLRPALVLLASTFGPKSSGNIRNIAAAVEILHMATLIHDDIIDESRYRRGQPAVHERFGKDVAVYTGDYLFTRSILLLADCKSVDHLAKLARALKIVCESEVCQHSERYNVDLSIRQYLRKIKGKTAALFAISASLGAVESGAGQSVVARLRRFGSYLGMAFQIRDDILDFTGQESELGKPTSSDMRKGNFTLPVIYALQSAAHTGLRSILKKPYISPEDWDAAYELVKTSNGIEKSQIVFNKYCQKARRELDLLPHSLAVDTLGNVLSKLQLNPFDKCSTKPASDPLFPGPSDFRHCRQQKCRRVPGIH